MRYYLLLILWAVVGAVDPSIDYHDFKRHIAQTTIKQHEGCAYTDEEFQLLKEKNKNLTNTYSYLKDKYIGLTEKYTSLTEKYKADYVRLNELVKQLEAQTC